MQRRRVLAVLLAALVAGGCVDQVPGTDSVGGSVPTDRSQARTPPTASVFEVRYDHRPGHSTVYDIAVRQDINYLVSGADALGAISADPLPETGRVLSRASSQISYDALETSTEAATTIKISAMFPSVETSAWADGNQLDPEIFDELTRALAVINPIGFTVGVNDRNAALTSSGLGGLNVLNGEVGSLTSLSNNQLSRPLGPVFPENREVTLGRPWTVESVQEGPGGDLVVVESSYTAVEHKVVDDVNHLTIEGTTETGGFELDFSEAFEDIYAGLISEASGRALTEAETEALEAVVFSIAVQPSSGISTYSFDLDGQRIVSSTQESMVELVWTLHIPETGTTPSSGFELSMAITRRAEFSLAP